MVARGLSVLRRTDVLIRLGLCVLAALVMWGVTGSWAPSFSYRTGFIPNRDIIARVDFSEEDPVETAKRKDQARSQAEFVYEQDARPLEELRQELKNKVSQLASVESYDKVEPKLWEEFSPAGEGKTPETEKRKFDALKGFFMVGMDSGRFDEAIKRAFVPLERSGVIDVLQHTSTEGSQQGVKVRPTGKPQWTHRAAVEEVLVSKIKPQLQQRLIEELKSFGGMSENSLTVADLTYAWLDQRLQNARTLQLDREASEAEKKAAADAVVMVIREYKANDAHLAEARQPLDSSHVQLLRREYEAWRKQMGWSEKIGHSLATFGMYGALYTLCGFYILNRRRKLVEDLNKFSVLLGAIVVTVILCWGASKDQWRAEIIPLMLFGMTAAIAYEKELALLLAASVALIVSFLLDQGLAEFVILVSSVAAAILFLARIRSRTKLIYVGAISGVVVVATTFGVGTLVGQAFGATDSALNVVEDWLPATWTNSFVVTLAIGAFWFGSCSLLASVLMTGLLPFIERLFDVQTDISLLELGDVQHPLLQQLVRRAPGTYNHSINVASIAETAAEAIGCNGLLVRVGAYFHDIGKMLKPAYFVENQGTEGNRHEFLQPAMSTLVIIAHVKDGADLARQHHLPRTIIDFIEQHHGTTLVEYFYRREAKRLESDPTAAEPDESTFRYPGPKPQTKETAVLMLADVVESASRALSDPTPARIESLVHDLALKRLLDGQFDECGLTLQELRILEDSLVKSLTAVYHGRVKYPEHQTV
ncbi:HD domain protein [Anatilimnocola aggregata]|uniref:HD domain protein n=2 Tax=Anatilimnocola aggregata TaxID=2528021 RepID=A0A517YII4_9BACT|nr:HD domain protein [Anatilimnocola aggregata]